MKLCISQERLWEAIEKDENLEVEAGRPIRDAADVVEAIRANGTPSDCPGESA